MQALWIGDENAVMRTENKKSAIYFDWIKNTSNHDLYYFRSNLIYRTVNLGFYELGFYELSPFMNFFQIPLRNPISLRGKNIGFYEPRFLWTSAFMNFFLGPLECLFMLLTSVLWTLLENNLSEEILIFFLTIHWFF